MLLTINKVLSLQEVEHCRQQLGSATWQAGALTAGASAARVKTNLQVDPHCDIARALSSALVKKLHTWPEFVSAALPHKIFPPRFNCYQQGGHYGLHTDSAILRLDNGEALRGDISGTLFLSEPDSYEGGELMIETRFGAQSVKLAAGDLLMYPASSLHEVRPVTSGQRLAAFFWVQSMVASDDHREKLFSLDQSIQVLSSERGADDAEVLNLSALYHNLLRDWATV